MTTEGWNRFLKEGLYSGEDVDKHNSNTRYPFSVMCKKFGIYYIEWLGLNYVACVETRNISLEEFKTLNGNPPDSFMTKTVLPKMQDMLMAVFDHNGKKTIYKYRNGVLAIPIC